MCPNAVICLHTHLFSLLDTNNFISEGGREAWDILCLSIENQIFFQASGIIDQKYFPCIHEVKDTCIRDLNK